MATEGGGNGRLTLSEERLKQLLAEFKLDLVTELRNYATMVAFNQLDARVKLLELWQAQMGGQQQERRRVSGSTLAWITAIAGLLAVIAWLAYYVTHP